MAWPPVAVPSEPWGGRSSGAGRFGSLLPVRGLTVDTVRGTPRRGRRPRESPAAVAMRAQIKPATTIHRNPDGNAARGPFGLAPPCPSTGTPTVDESPEPSASQAVSRTLYVPAMAYTWSTTAPAPACPSPKSQVYCTMPWSSVEADPSNWTALAARGAEGENTNEGRGCPFGGGALAGYGGRGAVYGESAEGPLSASKRTAVVIAGHPPARV